MILKGFICVMVGGVTIIAILGAITWFEDRCDVRLKLDEHKPIAFVGIFGPAALAAWFVGPWLIAILGL